MSHQISGLGQHMLAVVQQQQELPRAQESRHLLADGATGIRRESQRRGHRSSHERGVLQRREVDPDHAVGKGVSHVLDDREGQARLAHPSRTGQGEERDGLIEQEDACTRALRLAADEASARDGQRCPERR